MREAKRSSSIGFSVTTEKSAVLDAEPTKFQSTPGFRLRATTASGTDERFARIRGTNDGPN
jgi:hypothetical protein